MDIIYVCNYCAINILALRFFKNTIIIEVQTKRILWELADMIVLKILAVLFVVTLTMVVATVPFLYCMISALCRVGYVVLPLVLFIGDKTLGGVVFLILEFLVLALDIPAIID